MKKIMLLIYILLLIIAICVSCTNNEESNLVNNSQNEEERPITKLVDLELLDESDNAYVIFELNSELDLDFQITLIQQYDTGHSLDDVINRAMDHGALWLEKRLVEMKKD